MAPKKDYTPQQMSWAIEAVRKGVKISDAAKKFNVPRITLHNKMTGKSPIECSMGPSTILSKQEEDILENWIKDMADKHIPITKEELLDSVQRIIVDKKQETPFTKSRPGKKWYSSFMKRHPTIAERTAQNLCTARNNVTQEDIEKWFSVVEGDLKDRGLAEVLKNPERIFNTDESAFFLNPKPGRVLAKKGDKNVYASSGDDKENLTVLVTGNAAGDLAPTLVVYNYARIPSSISDPYPDDWAIGRSESGWMCAGTFYEYMTSVFNPWLEKQTNIAKPILFFLDGHKSHLTLHLSNFCSDNGIEVIALNPNSTHILQPMDLAVFRPLKLSWREAVKTWKMRNLGQVLKKHHFAPVLKPAVDSITVETIKNGFRAGGLYPFGPEYVDMSKIKSQNRQKADSTCQSEFLKTLENKIETILSSEKLKLFKDLYFKSRHEIENLLPDGGISLYLIWASSKQTPNHDVGNEETVPNTSVEKSNPLSETNNQNINDTPIENGTSAVLSHNINDSEPSKASQNTCLSLNTSNEPNVGQGDLQIYNSLPKSSDKTPIKIVCPGTSNCVIPSPFKRNLFWPETDETTKNKKRKLKEKIPFTITSPAWKAYHTKKEEEKRKQIEEKELRAKKREEKKLENIDKKKKVTKQQKNRSESSETETEIIYAESDESVMSDGSESDDTPLNMLVSSRQQLSKGSYVIVLYEGQHFPGVIENINKDEFEVSTMTFSTGNTYKWPEKPDLMWYQRKDIVEHICPPILINKRGFFTVKEMEKYSVFTS